MNFSRHLLMPSVLRILATRGIKGFNRDYMYIPIKIFLIAGIARRFTHKILLYLTLIRVYLNHDILLSVVLL